MGVNISEYPKCVKRGRKQGVVYSKEEEALFFAKPETKVKNDDSSLKGNKSSVTKA